MHNSLQTMGQSADSACSQQFMLSLKRAGTGKSTMVCAMCLGLAGNPQVQSFTVAWLRTACWLMVRVWQPSQPHMPFHIANEFDTTA